MKGALLARILLGLIYFVFGLNGFLNFLPPHQMPEAAGAFAGALGATGYFFPLLKATEVLGGLSLLAGFFAPLALIVLAPITIQIFMFHAVLTPGLENLVLPVAMIALHLGAAHLYRILFLPLLAPKPVAAAIKFENKK
jgi:uncharacterized membrane protein YphA (DoxX/SURF4 family)